MRQISVRLGLAALTAFGAALATLPASVFFFQSATPVVRADGDQASTAWDMQAEFQRQLEAGRQREIDRRRQTELALDHQGAVQVDPATGVVSSVAGVCRVSGASAEPYLFLFTWDDPDTGAPVTHARPALPSGECP